MSDDPLEPEAVLSLVIQLDEARKLQRLTDAELRRRTAWSEDQIARLRADVEREQRLCTTFARQVVELQAQLATARLDVEAARRERDAAQPGEPGEAKPGEPQKASGPRCALCRYPECCGDEWCMLRGCCGHEREEEE